MTNKEHIRKLNEIKIMHQERLLSTEKEEKSIREIIKEGKTKGYTILPADEIEKNLQGLVLFKTIDGVELAYNPLWPIGQLGKTTDELLKEP